MHVLLLMQVDAEEYFDDQREVEYFCFNQQYHRAPKQVPVGWTVPPSGCMGCVSAMN